MFNCITFFRTGIIPCSSIADFLLTLVNPAKTTCNYRDQEQYYKNEKQDFGYGSSARSNTGKTKNRGNNRYHQKYYCPT
jgi:hypothetical protein